MTTYLDSTYHMRELFGLASLATDDELLGCLGAVSLLDNFILKRQRRHIDLSVHLLGVLLAL